MEIFIFLVLFGPLIVVVLAGMYFIAFAMLALFLPRIKRFYPKWLVDALEGF